MGLFSVIQLPELNIEKLELGENALVMVLDGLEKPGNIGTIIRTCDGAGVDAVFLCNRKSRLTNPLLIKGSMGAVFTIPIVEFDNVRSCIDWLVSHHFNIFLADTKAEISYKHANYTGNTALVMGCERYGISGDWYSSSPKLISIPMLGICDSLNVGVAASILAYEAACLKERV
jgi:TrmH family RNA methyltransferase